MSQLINPDGTHEKESPESHYMRLFFPAFLNAATRANILGNEIGDNYFLFRDKGKTITITVKVKQQNP